MTEDRVRLVLESVAANVRRTRMRRGLTQERLAELSELHLTYVQAIERGRRNTSVGVLVRLAVVLEVPASRLLRPATLPPVKRGRPRTSRRTRRED